MGYVPTKDAFARKDDETKWICWVDRNAEGVIRTAAANLIEKAK